MAKTESTRKCGITLHLPESTLRIIDREAERRKSSRSRYIQDLILGVPVPDGRKKRNREKPTPPEPMKEIRVCISEEAMECLRQLAAARKMSRARCAREILQSRIAATNVYWKLDLAELQPVFEDLGTIASGMQELVLRPDRTPEEQTESRSVQKQMLTEIRRIRTRMEEWGDTRIGTAQAAFAEGEGLRERPGLSDVSVG